MKFAAADRLVTLIGPDHHGYVGRMRAAMQALGHPPEALEVLIVQLVTLLRDGQPVKMSKRRGEFVLMEELLEEVGRDAARFTFLTRRHDSPLDFDLAVAARQTTDNPVYYVQYAHARIRSIARQAAAQGIAVPAWDEIDTTVLRLPEEQQIIKRLLQYPDVLAAAARAREPHRVAYWLQELAGPVPPVLPGSPSHPGRPRSGDRAPRAVSRGGTGGGQWPRPSGGERTGEHVMMNARQRQRDEGRVGYDARGRRLSRRPRP